MKYITSSIISRKKWADYTKAELFVCLLAFLVFNSTFSTNRLYRAIWVWSISHRDRRRDKGGSNEQQHKNMLRYDRQTEPGLFAVYNIRPRKGAGQFLQPRSPHRTWKLKDSIRLFLLTFTLLQKLQKDSRSILKADDSLVVTVNGCNRDALSCTKFN